MIVEPKIVSYINSLDMGNSDICNLIEKEALADNVPIIRKEMGNLLKVLLALKQPSKIPASLEQQWNLLIYSYSEHMPKHLHHHYH